VHASVRPLVAASFTGFPGAGPAPSRRGRPAGAIQTTQWQYQPETERRYLFSIEDEGNAAMTDHSIVSASRGTHLKVAFLAVAASIVFVALLSASKVDTARSGMQSAGVVKASTTMNVAASGARVVR
jgi:hypothetical protein